jgi:hypothetical protein
MTCFNRDCHAAGKCVAEPNTGCRASILTGAQPAPAAPSGESVEALAHRMAWRYKKSTDPHHSDTYTFNRATLLDFAATLMTPRALAAIAAPAAQPADSAMDSERLDWITQQISGAELRRIGVEWPTWSPEFAREAIDRARALTAASKENQP